MSPTQRAESLVTAIDAAEAQAAGAGRGIADAADDLAVVARRLAGPADFSRPADGGGWHGRAGAAARRSIEDADAAARTLSGQCLYLADILRVEGSWLARALVAGGTETEVEDADRALAARLAEAADALAGYTDAATQSCIDLATTTGDDPRTLATLWHSLGPADRERLARDHPELGSTAGLPAAQADALNRTRLSRLLGAGKGTADTAGLDSETREQLAALAAHLAEDPRRHLLALHEDGRAVVANADPDGADRVVTLIPGTGSSLASLGLQGERAEAVCEAAPVDAPTESCVAVTWQGYHAPPDIPSAAVSTDRATAHAGELRDFAAGLDAVDVQDGHDAPHAAVGYSYGSTVLGAAASDPRGLAADRMVHVGSPGAYVDSLADQRIDEGGTSRPVGDDEVAAVESRWDPVPWWSITGVLGALPGSEEFGGVSVDVTEPGAGAGEIGRAHSGYFASGTVSLAEIGRLVLGRE